MMPKLTPHFYLEEFIHSEIADRRQIPNGPSPGVLANLQKTAEHLEDIRFYLGAPIIITSGYRSRELNAIVGGVKDSAHIQGLAVDFICPSIGTPFLVATHLAARPNFPLFELDQLIYEWSWVHVGWAMPGQWRREEKLTRNSNGFIPGIVNV